MVALPSNVGIGYLTGAFVTNGGPDLAGRLTFTVAPTGNLSMDATASPVPMSIIRLDRTFKVNLDGYLVDETGAQPIALIATDDPDLFPDLSYTVSSHLAGGQSPFPTFPMEIPTGVTVDLVDVLPIPKVAPW